MNNGPQERMFYKRHWKAKRCEKRPFLDQEEASQDIVLRIIDDSLSLIEFAYELERLICRCWCESRKTLE